MVGTERTFDSYGMGPTGRLPVAPTTAEVSLTWLTVVASALFVFSGFDGSMGVSDVSSLGGHWSLKKNPD